VDLSEPLRHTFNLVRLLGPDVATRDLLIVLRRTEPRMTLPALNNRLRALCGHGFLQRKRAVDPSGGLIFLYFVTEGNEG